MKTLYTLLNAWFPVPDAQWGQHPDLTVKAVGKEFVGIVLLFLAFLALYLLLKDVHLCSESSALSSASPCFSVSSAAYDLVSS